MECVFRSLQFCQDLRIVCETQRGFIYRPEQQSTLVNARSDSSEVAPFSGDVQLWMTILGTLFPELGSVDGILGVEGDSLSAVLLS